jgi:YHS domain-containing protein
MRAILYLIASVLIISVLKAVIGIVSRALGDFVAPRQGNESTAGYGQQPRKPAVPVSEALQKDPVCGAFVAPSTAVTKTSGGMVHYFCSSECRDKFKAA